MTTMYDDPNPAFVVAVASTTVELHDAGRRCQCCTDIGCAQDAWAQQILAEHRATRQTIPHQRPAAPDDRRSKENLMDQLDWQKPNRCDNSGPNCVEVAVDCASSARYVRDSKNPDGPMLTFTEDEWETFTASVRNGQY